MPANELPIPPAATEDLKARELLRVWAANKKQHVSLATGLWEDPASWGIMLVDLARHVANAYRINDDKDPLLTLRRIREGFEAEWNHPTGPSTGDVLDDQTR
ncbi:MAG: DUF5076 domain-containing protein [Planctomycetota bacterium]